jgi:hypothetical protein
MALATLLSRDLFGDESSGGEAGRMDEPSYDSNFSDLARRAPHFRPRARAVIQLFMNGGPSQVDLLDPKPELSRSDGRKPPAAISEDLNQPGRLGNLMKSPFTFSRCGESGMEISEALPHLQKHADEICVVRSMHTTNHEHGPALRLIHGGGEKVVVREKKGLLSRLFG